MICYISYSTTPTVALEEPVLGTGLRGLSPCSLTLPVLGLARSLEEQTWALTLLDQVT